MKHTIIVGVFGIAALITFGVVADQRIQDLTAERDVLLAINQAKTAPVEDPTACCAKMFQARREWCWLMDVEGLGANNDGGWTGSLTGPEGRKQYDAWCTGQPSPAEWYGVE